MSRTRQILRLCAVGAIPALAITLLCPLVQAATLLALDLTGLVRGSERIVVATALSRSARRDTHSRYLVTDVELRVDEALKGDGHGGERFVVTRLGGRVDGLALQVPGAATFALGRQHVVFLRNDERRGEWRIVAMSQGVLRIESNMALPGGRGMTLVQQGDDGKLRPAPAALMHPEPVDALKARIRTLVKDNDER